MRTYEDRLVTQHEIKAITCDGCGRVVQNTTRERRWEPEGWHGFHSGHNDWSGADEVTSQMNDACSGTCFIHILQDLVEDYERHSCTGYPSLYVDGMDYRFLKSLVAEVKTE